MQDPHVQELGTNPRTFSNALNTLKSGFTEQ